VTDKAPVEAKVYAATIGTGAGAVVSAFIVWLLGVIVWRAPFTAPGAAEAVASVPGPVTAIVGLVITVGSSFIGGYWAKHTPRPQPEVDLVAERDDVAVRAMRPQWDDDVREDTPDDV